VSANLEPKLRTAVQLRPMQLRDVVEVLRIEQAAYAFPWSQGNFVDSLAAGYDACVVVAGHELVAYFLTMPVFDEQHLLNITVAPPYQSRGLGRWLLGQVRARAVSAGAVSLWLEVRPSNINAIALYESAGFAQVGKRPNYYPAPGGQREDAILMKQFL
jgi:[ribosomal protein S18]-alanine N-acetyltransferase